ncbi:MAG: NTP transferase domain-containing protein [bacterium]|nr:NTP transferase domain-containing protein [bacterium]
MHDLTWLVLAGGRGKRMKSSVPKVQHRLGGKPILNHILDALSSLEAKRKVVVLGYKEKSVRDILPSGIEVIVQQIQGGTAHAVREAERALADFEGDCLVLNGDLPLLTPQTIEEFVSFHRERKNVASLLTTYTEDFKEAPVVIRSPEGDIGKIVKSEAGLNSSDENETKEVAVGGYCFQATFFFWALGQIKPHSDKEEEDLNDCLGILKERGHQIESFVVSDQRETIDINTRVDLAKAEGILRDRTVNSLMLGGVTIMDPGSTSIDAAVTIEPDTVIYPFTTILGETKIGKDCVIGPQTFLLNAEVGAGATIYASFVNDSKVEAGDSIGPFANIISKKPIL